MRATLLTTFALALLGACNAPGPVATPAIVAAPQDYAIAPLAAGETGWAVRAAKVLTMDDADRVLDPGMVVVRDGRIEYVGPPVPVPDGFPSMDFEDEWLSPGMVDLHSHIQTGSWGDINDMVRPTNPELRVRPTIRPSNRGVKTACAGGVTTLFGIPGSGTSMSGFGVLYKTKTDAGYEEIVLADPGGLKIAQNYNPQRRGGDLGTSWAGLGWLLHDVNRRALSPAAQERHDPAYEDLVRVLEGELPVLIHCASAEGVSNTVRMWKVDWDTNCIVSHGSWDGYKAAAYAAEHGVPVNHGPRTIEFNGMAREGRFIGGAAEYTAAGVPNFSLNTDAGVIPQEELFLQGSMSARYGADSYQMMRALTTHPAKSILTGHRIGSLEPGKDADLVVTTGDPLDPRSRVEVVLIEGRVEYSRARDGQWF
jgi:imidazolonepropionase-like amidohydrolase